MHFFSPVPKMKLCEVIFGLLTAQDVLEEIKDVGKKMGKTLILADDKPGFIVNRALLPMLNEACVIVGLNIGTVEDVDNGMKLGCNHPMGPLELADMIGLDILLNVMTVMEQGDLGDASTAPPCCCGRWSPPASWAARAAPASIFMRTGRSWAVNPVLTRTREH